MIVEMMVMIRRIIIIITPRSIFLLEELASSHTVWNLPAFHGNRKFLTALMRARHMYQSWCQINTVHAPVPLLEDQF
jgi:hypothetical protein